MPAATISNLDTFKPVASLIHSKGSSWMPRSRLWGCEPHNSCDRPSSRKVSPIVAMNSVICGWLTSGRSTIRSVNRPRTIIAPSVASNASQKLRPISCKPTNVAAAKNTIAPCAKLNTPDAL